MSTGRFYRDTFVHWEEIPDEISNGIYNRINYPDGRFLAIRPMYFSAWIILGVYHSPEDTIVMEFGVGTQDMNIYYYYHILLMLIHLKVPFASIPRPQTKLAIDDKAWCAQVKALFDDHMKQGAIMIWTNVASFHKMHMQTLRPLIHNTKRSIDGKRKK